MNRCKETTQIGTSICQLPLNNIDVIWGKRVISDSGENSDGKVITKDRMVLSRRVNSAVRVKVVVNM